MSGSLVWVDGVVSPLEAHAGVHSATGDGCEWGDRVAVSAASPALCAGAGVFETFAGGPGRWDMLEAHLGRLCWGAGRIGSLPLPAIEFAAVLHDLCVRAGYELARCRLALYPPDCRPRLIVSVAPLPNRAARRERGVALRICSHRRGVDPTASIKTESRAFYDLALREARLQGADDALLLGVGGEVRETTRANVFLVHGERVTTPVLTDAFLPGIARAQLIVGLRASAGVDVHEETIALDQLLTADSIVLTNAVFGVLPVRSLQGEKLAFPKNLDQWLQALRSRGAAL